MMVGLTPPSVVKIPPPCTSWRTCPKTIRIATSPSSPNACTDNPEILPPVSATFTVSPIDMLSRALFAVLTFAYVALFIPSTQAHDDISAPNANVIPVVLSTNRLNVAASNTTTITIVLYSVIMNVLAPSRIIPAISTISAVPSESDLILP